MIVKRLLIIATVLGLVVLAGCGGKKAMEEPAAAAEPTGQNPPIEEEPIVEEPTGGTETSPVMLNDVFFDFDKYSLTAEAKSTLEANSGELKRGTSAEIIIEGHCDERGTKAYNLALGEKRANAAKDYLVALGVNGGRLTTISYGKERPFDPGHSEEAWAKNRRAHFVIKK